MKFYFGERSEYNLESCSFFVTSLLREALALGIMDFAVIEGFRNEAKQNRLYESNKSKVKWPYGKHNCTPSKAADCVPWINGRVSWNELHCCVLSGIIQSAARILKLEIRWGGNWDRDGEPITDQDFQDLVHYEEVE